MSAFVMLVAAALTAEAQDSPQAPAAVLSSLREIRSLSVAQAKEGRPVKLQGIVTFSRPGLATLFIHDGKEGIFIQQPTDYERKGPEPGDRVEVSGITGEGLFAPVIQGEQNQGAKIEVLGRGELPLAKKVTGEELSRPDMDCDWVEVEAKISEVMTRDNGVVFQCNAGPCDFHVIAEGWIDPQSVPWDLAESKVLIRGVVATVFNTSRQMTRRFIRVNTLGDIRPLDSGPTSRLPPKPARVSELFRLDGPGPGDLVKLKGVATLAVPGRGIFLRTEDGGLWVQTAQPVIAEPGTRIEVEGWPRTGEMKPFLQARGLQAGGKEAAPLPQFLNARESLNSQYDSELISVDAELLDFVPSVDGTTLVLRESGVVFRALAEGSAIGDLKVGSRLRLTGIARITSADVFYPLQEEDKLLILLRSPADVVLVAAPPWWTPQRVAIASSVLIAGMLAIYPVARSRRRREEETKHREFEAVLAERGRFAREIHDSLAQGLTSISLQLECARAELHSDAPKLRTHIETARRLVRDSLREARRTIWNLRPLALGEADLASALQKYAVDLARDGSISCSQEIEGTPRPLPQEHEAALLRIGQEALTNAIRHAEPSHVLLRLRFGAEWITLTVRDDGRGFDVAAKAAKGFGLTGMHERVAALAGSLSIDSIPGEGTEVSATLPT